MGDVGYSTNPAPKPSLRENPCERNWIGGVPRWLKQPAAIAVRWESLYMTIKLQKVWRTVNA